MTNLVINSQAISQHNGLFSLNDLHKSAGGEPKHKPTNFMRNAEVQELIAEIEQVSNLRLEQKSVAYETIHGGKKNGTFVCRELVYRYAMWISPKFSLMVIRAFDAMNTGAIPCLPPKSTANDRTPLRQAVTALCGKLGIMHPEAYALVHQYMGVEHIDEISMADLPRAVEYVHRLMMGGIPRLNIPFIQNVLTDTLYQNRKAQDEVNGIRTIVKGLLHHLEDTQDRLAHNERNVLALKQRFIA